MTIMRFFRQLMKVALGKSVLYNVNRKKHDKRCLMVYTIQPFLCTNSDAKHQNTWQSREIARILDELGYCVDVVDYYADIVWLKNKYDAIFDICVKTHPIYEKKLKENAKRIVYFTGSESLFANNAELQRIDDLEKRRGTRLLPRRQAPLISKRVEGFDGTIFIGNEYNLSTYRNLHLPKTYIVPNTGYDFNAYFDDKKKKPTSFLFFGSSGCVHKGLDLLLEIFSEKNFPCKLYVCGSIEGEQDFTQEYEKELYHTHNIETCGLVGIYSCFFKRLCDECVYAILPSCSEGMAGSIATCLSAGMIPICSRECGFEEDEVIILNDCRIETIKRAVLEAATYDMEWIRRTSMRSIELSKTKYCDEAFSREMKKALSKVLSQNGNTENNI